MAWICLVDDHFQSLVIRPVHQLQPLIGVSVNDNWHTRDKHEYSWYWHAAVVTIAQNHECLLLCRLAEFLFVLRDEDPQLYLVLLLVGIVASMFKFQRFLFSGVTAVMPDSDGIRLPSW
jgi:hypothetical protein